MSHVVIDTNLLIHAPEFIKGRNDIILLSPVLEELDKHKMSSNRDLAFSAREATRMIEDNDSNIRFEMAEKCTIDGLDKNYNDNKIISFCRDNNLRLATSDLLMKYKAKTYEIELEPVKIDTESHYTGVKELYITSSKEDQMLLARFYEEPENNICEMVENQYLYIWDKEKPTYNEEGIHTGYEFIDCFRFDGVQLIKPKPKPVFSRYMGEKIKPINKKQIMLFDMLQNSDITINSCFGKFGVGKDFVMLAHALQMVDKQQIDQIIWARNNVELEDVPTLGTLPGDKIDKLIEFAMPLADHVGGVEGLRMLLAEGKLSIQHLGSLRGRDIKKSIIYCTEFQNNTDVHAELLIGRIGKGTELWLNGDLKQTDKNVYRRKSGMLALSRLKGESRFGQVTLDKVERSDSAKLAEKVRG